MNYDSKCFQLAAAFLEDHPAINTLPMAEQLAQSIQTTIEDWIETTELWQQNKN